MLACFPREMNVLDRDDCDLVVNGLECHLMAYSLGPVARISYADSDVIKYEQRSSHESVKANRCNRKPDVVSSISRYVDVNKPQKDDPCEDMLQDEDLISHASQGGKRRDKGPHKNGPCSESIFYHWHHRKFELNEVCPHPFSEEESSMHGNCYEKCARCPSMEPVESFV